MTKKYYLVIFVHLSMAAIAMEKNIFDSDEFNPLHEKKIIKLDQPKKVNRTLSSFNLSFSLEPPSNKKIDKNLLLTLSTNISESNSLSTTSRTSKEKKRKPWKKKLNFSATEKKGEKIFLLPEDNEIPTLKKIGSMPAITRKKSFFSNKEALKPISSDESLRRSIITGDVAALKKEQIPAYIFDKTASEWAVLAGHEDLAKALDPKTIFKNYYWKRATHSAPKIITAKKELFFGATYGDLSLIENAKKDLVSFYLINEDLITPSMVAKSRDYLKLASYLQNEVKLSKAAKNAILAECLEESKIAFMNASFDEKHYWLSWHFVHKARELIDAQFNDTFLEWLLHSNFRFPFKGYDAAKKIFADGKISFTLTHWNLLERNKLSQSRAIIEEKLLTEDQQKEITDQLFGVFHKISESQTIRFSELVLTLDQLISNGADLEAVFETNIGERTAAQWANDLDLKWLVLPLTNKFLWYLVDKTKLVKVLEDSIVEYNLDAAGF